MPTVKTLLPQKQADVQLIRVAAYCRVSSDSTEQKESFAAQVEYYTGLIGGNPFWTLADIYADEGVTGTSMRKRDDFNRMIADCRRGKIDRIITKSVSRFARNTVECLDTVRKLSKLGVSVLFEKEQIDTSKMSSEFLLALAGVQAQDESVSISGNMRWSYEKRMKEGDFIGCKSPIGYSLIKGSLIINESEAEIVRMIYDMFLSGVSKPRIVQYLNEHSVPHRNTRIWNTASLNYILNNERYVGDALLQKFYTTGNLPFRKEKNKGQKTMYYVQNSHAGIISKARFDAAKSMQARRKKRNIQPHGLTKLLICQDCGHTFRQVCSNNNVYWSCSYQMSGHSDCQRIRVDEEDVIAALMRMIEILHQHCDSILIPMIKALEKLKSKENGTFHKLYEIDKTIAEINNQLYVISKLQLDGILLASDFAAQNNELTARLSRLRTERMNLLRQNKNDDDLIRLREVCETISSLEKPSEQFDEDLVRKVVEKIIIKSPTHIQIYVRGGLVLDEHLPNKKRRCGEE